MLIVFNQRAMMNILIGRLYLKSLEDIFSHLPTEIEMRSTTVFSPRADVSVKPEA